MRILSNQQTADLLGLDEIIAAVEAAMISYEDNTSTIPKRMHIDHGDNTLLCMPSFTNDFFATKLVSVVPGNKEKGLPVTNGAMLLNDTSTGMPLALLNAARLTALRTGAVGAIGARYTTPDSIDSIGLIGLGIQGMHQAVFACSIRPIKKIYVLKRGEENYRQFIDFLHSYHSQIEIIP